MTDLWVVLEGMLPYLLVLVGLIILFLVIREFRLMYTGTGSLNSNSNARRSTS